MTEKVKRHAKIDACECNTSPDPMRRLIRDLTAEAFTEWLIECHGLGESSRETVISNMEEQFKWHRLQGRLDRYSFLGGLAQLLRMRLSGLSYNWKRGQSKS